MSQFFFTPQIDVPLVVFTTIAFVLHLNRWAVRREANKHEDHSSRLSMARRRVILLFACLLLAGWLLNFAVWAIFAILLALGMIVALIFGEGQGSVIVLAGAAYLIHEWALGFPELAPDPCVISSPSAMPVEGRISEGSTGTTISALRPMGDAEFNGTKILVTTSNRGWLDAGVTIKVMGYRQGIACVEAVDIPDDGTA